MKKLLLLLLLLILPTAVAHAAAEAGMEQSRGVIGILPLPEVFGGEPCTSFTPREIELFQAPRATKPMGRIYQARPSALPAAGGCQGPTATVAITEPRPREEPLPTLEYAYEKHGAIVLRREGRWFAIALRNGYAWVQVADADRYLPVARLLKDALAYLRGASRIALRKSPGRGMPVWSPGRKVQNNLPVEVLAVREVSGQIWVQVRLLEHDPCTNQKTNVDPVTGWLPFHDATRMPTVWFHPRGC